MSFSGTTTARPEGFYVTRTGDDGWPLIIYQTAGQVELGFGRIVFLAGWPAVCIFGALAVFKGSPIDLLSLCVVVVFWAAEFLVIGGTLWHFWGATLFTFAPARLVVERSLFGYGRRREFAKQAIHTVRQVREDGDSESPTTWGLVIVGEVKGTLLSGQPIDKSDWLGPVVADWAGVAFEPSAQRS